MALSIFDIFKISIGPSSSHTIGPMKAAKLFLESLPEISEVTQIKVSLHGSLAFTGLGHGTDKAIVWGLQGQTPEDINPDSMYQELDRVKETQKIQLFNSQSSISFNIKEDITFNRQRLLPLHSNGMMFYAYKFGKIIKEATYYSTGGGFVLSEDTSHRKTQISDEDKKTPSAHNFNSGRELLKICSLTGKSISQVVLENENEHLSLEEINLQLEKILKAMNDCINKGLTQEGTLPGPMKINRRAPALYKKLSFDKNANDPLEILDWVNLYAIAVNEENAAGSKVVTAPTNGASGIIPAVLRYYTQFRNGSLDGAKKFLLTSGAIATLYKKNASFSGAEVGCQGEVGVACSMAAAGLVEALGGTPSQVEEAAEIGIEHNLGLTCDPVGGLVQIPCIERNAMGAVKAINAARIALKGNGLHHVSLDSAIKTMAETGEDMKTKYKETSEGGLAVNITEC